jgi:phosphoglycerate dehydrogenase-like enzyme
VFSPIVAAVESYARLQSEGCEVRVAPQPWAVPVAPTEDELVEAAAGAQALVGSMIYSTSISRRVLEASDDLRIVAKYSIGCEDVDVEAATERGVLVTYGPTESNWGGVAEGTLGNMLCLLKKMRERDAYLKGGGAWRDPSLMGTYVGARADGYPGITIGIVGLGRVGTRLADLLRPWRARVIACDPYIEDEHFVEHGVERVDLPTLLEQADVVTLHVYLNRQTRHLVGAAELARMKPTAVLLNASRGGVIDEAALIEALQAGRIAGAGLDVFEREPLPLDSPLRTMDNRVLLSPHMITNNLGSGVGPAIDLATDALLTALRGGVPERELIFNPEAIPAWQARFGGSSVLAEPAAAAR